MPSAIQFGRGSRLVGYGNRLYLVGSDTESRNWIFDCTRFMYSTNFWLVLIEGCGGVPVVGVDVVGVVVVEDVEGLVLAAFEGSVDLGLAVTPSVLD